MRNKIKPFFFSPQTENHDNFRTANLLGLEFLDILLVTTMTLPGVVCIYYGQEIGMSDGVVRPERIRDPNNDGMNVLQTRDFERLPMQWDNSLNAGKFDINYLLIKVEGKNH